MAGETRDVSVRLSVVPGDTSGIDQAAQGAQRASQQAAQAQAQAAQAQAQAAQAGQQATAAAAAAQTTAAAAARPAPGMIPAGAVRAVGAAGAEPSAQAGGQQALIRAQQVASLSAAAASGNVQSLASSLAGLPGPVGIAGAAIGAVTGMIALLTSAFQRFRPSIQEAVETFQQSQSTLQRVREQGRATARDIFQTFSAQGRQALLAAQQAGDPEAQRRAAAAEQQRAGADVQRLANVDLAALQSRVQTNLEEVQRIARENRPGAPGVISGMAQELRGMFQQAGLAVPRELANLNQAAAREITPQQMRQWAEAVGGARVSAQATFEVARALQLPGGMVSARPGAVSERPDTGFRSQQGDILSLASVFQQEIVRSDREEQRFQAQMRLWEQYLEEMRRIGQGAVRPAVQ